MANPVTLVWDRNSEKDLAGYKVYIGTAPGTYTQTIDVGHVTRATIPDLASGETYFIAVTAYDIFASESEHSVEIQVTIPEPVLVPSRPPAAAGMTAATPSPQLGPAPLQPTTTRGISGFPASSVSPTVGPDSQAGPQVADPSPGVRPSPFASQGSGGGSAGGVTGEISSAVRSGQSSSITGSTPSGSPSAPTGSGSGGAPAQEGVLQRLLAAIGLQSAGQQDAKAATLYEEGRRLMTEGKFQDAIVRYQEAERLWNGLGAEAQVALAVEGIGTAFYGAEQYIEAVDAFGMALRLSRQLKDREQEARILNDLGMCYESLGHHAMAIERYRTAVEIWRALGRSEQVAVVLERLGTAQAAAGRFGDALTSYQQSLALFRDLGQVEKHQELEGTIRTIRHRLGRERSRTTIP